MLKSKLLLAIPARRLGEGPWLAGDDFTYADIAAAYLLYRYYNMPVARSLIPGVDAFYARLQQRPAFRTHSMVNFDGLHVRD